jgi:tetratricopeptide (TPR) repeat protein
MVLSVLWSKRGFAMLGCARQTLLPTRTRRLGFCLLLVLFSAGTELWGQAPFAEDRPTPYVPLQPPKRQEIDRRRSLKKYVLGLLLERDDQLLEALKAYEEAARLDPDAAAVFKAQVPLLLTLGREKDTLAVIGKVLDLDPSDHTIWFMAARLHKTMGNYAEARRALQRGLEAPGLQDHPDVAQQMYLDLASICEAADEIPQAIRALDQAAKILDHPDNLMDFGPFNRDSILARAAETHERIGNLYRKQKKFQEAIAAYKKAQTVNPERAGRLNFNLAQLLHEQGQLDQALVFLDAYLRFQPLGLEAYEMKIDVLQKLKKEPAIVPWLEQASRADANNVGLKVFLAKQYARAGLAAPAEKLYKALADETPSPDIYRGLFRLYQEDPAVGMAMALSLLNKTVDEASKVKGPPGLAAQQAKAMIGALRDDGPLAKELVRVAFRQAERDENLKFETMQLLAALADKNQKLEEAEKFYRLSLKEAKPGTEALVYSGLLRVLWREHKHQEIVQVCRDGLVKSQATNQILFHNEMAKALARLGKMDEAVKAVDRAIDFAGDNDKLAVRHLRVRILIQAEKFDQAEADCQALLKEYSGPGDIVEIRYLLSSVYSGRRQLAKSEEQLELILKIDPSNATVNNDLGYIWADQNKNLDKAEEMIRRAIDLDRQQRKLSRNLSAEDDKDNAAYIDSLGWVLFRRGKLDEARQQMELAVALADGADDPTVWDHLGDVYFRLERLDQARSAWEKSVHLFEKENRRKMDERYHEVRRKLKALETVQK